MINYVEKGFGLHEAIRSAGYELREHDGVWVTRPEYESAVQSIIDGYSLDDARVPVIAKIKELARVKILAFLPDWKQSNCNARMNELNMIRFSRDWTDEEKTEVQALQALWGRAEAIRNASNVIEQQIDALTDFASIVAYDVTAGWPE